MVIYKRFQIKWFDWETFGILQLRRGDGLQEMVAMGGSTVLIEVKFGRFDNPVEILKLNTAF